MDFNVLKQELVSHKTYSTWQFIEYTRTNIEMATFCTNTIERLINKMNLDTMEWQKDILADLLVDNSSTNELKITTENMISYKVDILGENIDPWFLFNKLLRDYFQYCMNSFDSMGQIINAGLLANKAKKVDSVDIQRMKETLNQQTYSTVFPLMQSWINNIFSSAEYKYIEAINNRTKHTANIANNLSMGIFGGAGVAEIGPFYRKGEQHNKTEVINQLQTTLSFVKNAWNDFLTAFQSEIQKDTYVDNRIHEISAVYQQKMKDGSNLVFAYIKESRSMEQMPDEIYVLFVKEMHDTIYAHECPFDCILITNPNDENVVKGRYIVSDDIGEDCLLHYRKYVKDEQNLGMVCLPMINTDNLKFYHSNPYFELKIFSDDDDFRKRVLLPF